MVKLLNVALSKQNNRREVQMGLVTYTRTELLDFLLSMPKCSGSVLQWKIFDEGGGRVLNN